MYSDRSALCRPVLTKNEPLRNTIAHPTSHNCFYIFDKIESGRHEREEKSPCENSAPEKDCKAKFFGMRWSIAILLNSPLGCELQCDIRAGSEAGCGGRYRRTRR